MLSKIKKFLGKTYQPLNTISLSSENLEANFNYLSSLDSKLLIAPVLKSNAYGHGIVEIAKRLEHLNAPFFCVDSIYEAYELLKAGIKTKILIMGYIDPENLKVKKLPFSYAVYDKNLLEVINKYQKGAGVHIKVDTGMHRLGITIDNLPEFVKYAQHLSNINIEGLMSHFAESEMPESPLTKLQIKNFVASRDILNHYNINPLYIHIGNSSGVLNSKSLDLAKFSNIARSGLALYGIDPEGTNTHLKPVLKLNTKIVQIKNIVKGERVGYNGTFVAKRTMSLGILPLGFYDGIDRRLSNKGVTTIDGIICPIVGRVSMNITTIDISKVSSPFVGQEVNVFSDKQSHPNSIYNSAKLADTTPYDLLVHLAASTRRLITYDL